VRAKAEEVFREVDADGSGAIDVGELRQAFLMMGADISTAVPPPLVLSGHAASLTPY